VPSVALFAFTAMYVCVCVGLGLKLGCEHAWLRNQLTLALLIFGQPRCGARICSRCG
jgi:hypothetical protein